MNEEWRPVIGFEARYEVSNLGRVRSKRIKIWQRGRANSFYEKEVGGRVLRPGPTSTGHLTVMLGRDGGSKTVHSLVMYAFVGPRPEGADIAHLDGNETNNVLGNLVYVSRSENNRHISTHDRRKRKIADIRRIRSVPKLRHQDAVRLSAEIGCGVSQIYNVHTRRHWAHVD